MKFLNKHFFLFFLLLKTIAYGMEANNISKEYEKQDILRFLLVGDVVGKAGKDVFAYLLAELRKTYSIDAVIVNGENAMENGLGISPEDVAFFKKQGVLAITSGNHVWENKEVYTILEQGDYLLRPANYSDECIGKGYAIFSVKGHTIAILNLMGRVFFNDSLDCPFNVAKQILPFLQSKTNIILVDFHAEVAYEKAALGAFLDGSVSIVYGTHTHIQTADEQIFSSGTGFITDLGCCASLNSIVGFEKEGSLDAFLYHHKAGIFKVAEKNPYMLCGILVDIDTRTGKTVHIERMRVIVDIPSSAP